VFLQRLEVWNWIVRSCIVLGCHLYYDSVHVTGLVLEHREGPALSTAARRSQLAPTPPCRPAPHSCAQLGPDQKQWFLFNDVLKYGDKIYVCVRACIYINSSSSSSSSSWLYPCMGLPCSLSTVTCSSTSCLPNLGSFQHGLNMRFSLICRSPPSAHGDQCNYFT